VRPLCSRKAGRSSRGSCAISASSPAQMTTVGAPWRVGHLPDGLQARVVGLPQLGLVDVGDVEHRLVGEQKQVGDPGALLGAQALRPDRLCRRRVPRARDRAQPTRSWLPLPACPRPLQPSGSARAASRRPRDPSDRARSRSPRCRAPGPPSRRRGRRCRPRSSARPCTMAFDLADLREELVASAAARAGALDQAGDVDELEARGVVLAGL